MKKRYKFGEILMYLREEYLETKHILEELSKHIYVNSNSSNFYFDVNLSNSNEKESKLRLIVMKKYSKLLKQIQKLRYDWYSQFLYLAFFDINRGNDNQYELKFDNILTPVDGSKRFTPSVKIIEQDKFNALVEEFLSLDIMKLHENTFYINRDFISLDYNYALISSTLGYKSLLSWDGKEDIIDYSVEKGCCPYLIEEILKLEIPVDYISSDWLKIFEKHESKFNEQIFFDVDIKTQNKHGKLKVNKLDNRKVLLSKI